MSSIRSGAHRRNASKRPRFPAARSVAAWECGIRSRDDESTFPARPHSTMSSMSRDAPKARVLSRACFGGRGPAIRYRRHSGVSGRALRHRPWHLYLAGEARSESPRCARSLISPSSLGSSAKGKDSTASIYSIGGFFEFFALLSGFVSRLSRRIQRSNAYIQGLDSLKPRLRNH